MKRIIVLLGFGILFPCISQAGAPPEIYCQILKETDDFEIKAVHLYLTKDETGKAHVHLEAETNEEMNIPKLMKNLDSSEAFGTPRLIETRKLNPDDDNTQFHISFPVTTNTPIELPAKDGVKNPRTGEMGWLWKGLMCENGEVVDVNAKGSDGKPYLIKLIRGFTGAEEISAALKAGADPNVNDATWGTPLSNAALICSPEVVQVLLKAGAKVNEKDSAQQNALGYSSLQFFQTDKCVQTAELLLQAGATAKGDCDILLYASQAPPTSVKVPPLVEKLIGAGADVNCKDDRTGATPLIHASTSENATVIKTLLAKGADPKIEMNDGATALKIAMENDNQEIIKLLKAAGAK